MTRVRRDARVACIAVLAALFAMVLAPGTYAPPVAPMRVEGQAFDAASSPLAPGTRIRAIVDGVDYSNGSFVVNPLGAYGLLVEGNHMLDGASDSPTLKEGADDLEDVSFVAGDPGPAERVFEEVVPFRTMLVATQDLHLAPAASQPAPLRIQGIVARPVTRANQYVVVCNPTSSAVDLADFYLEVNRPGQIHGPNVTMSGALGPNANVTVDLGSASFLVPTGDALKLAYDNPGGPGAPAAGSDVVLDRVEFNATAGGTLFWEPGNTILGDAPAPRIGHILRRATECADTDDPSDFLLEPEPGLPPNVPPAVTIGAPSPGAVVASGSSVRIEWTMSDETFANGELLVWVNVSYAGTAASLLAGSAGATSVTWAVPDVEAEDAVVTVDVVDPFGGVGSATSGTFAIRRPDGVGGLTTVLIAALAVVLIVALLVFVVLRARHRGPPKEGPPPKVTEPSAPAQAEAPPERRKTCPRCGTVVHERDWTCFFCGYRFESGP
jgi:hypothetical protein